MKSEPGTYALILQCDSNAKVQIGRWREISLEPGHYLYIGSAFGPGGLRARLLRHFRTVKRKHWHIDYLSEFVNPKGAWISYERERLEHQWAQVLYKMDVMSPVQGFGCSDCKCYSHLFHATTMPRSVTITRVLGGKPDLCLV